MNIGIDIGGSHIAVGLVDDNKNIILKKEHNWTKEEKSDLIEAIKYYCVKFITEFKNENNMLKIDKIGIGYPSKNIIDGIIYINNIELNLPKILNKEFKVPVYLKNDVKCSAICEKELGNLKEYDNCLFMTIGTGIGGAYFYQNKLVTPNKYQGFEIGHMIIQTKGKECRCGGQGCFEEYASMRVFRNEIEKLFDIENLKSYKMYEIIENKEKEDEVKQIIDTYLEYLTVGMCNLINIFEPDAICIGGSFSYYSSIFIEGLKERIKNNFKGRTIPQIIIAKFENDAGIIGASMLESNK